MGGALPLSLASGPLQAGPSGPNYLMICLTDIGQAIPTALLSRVLDVFISRSLPLSCALNFQNSEPRAIGPNSDISQLLGETAATEPGLFEIMATFQGRQLAQRFYQMRDAAELRKSVVDGLPSGATRADRYSVTSVFDGSSGRDLDLSAYHSAGFRAHIRPTLKTESAKIQFLGRSQLRIDGGLRIEMNAGTWDMTELNAYLHGSDDQMVSISLAGLERADPDRALQQLSNLADAVADLVDLGHSIVMRPIDLIMQVGPQPAPSMGILLYAPPDTSDPGPLRDFARDLAANNIPFTVAAHTPDKALWPDSSEFCTLGMTDATAGQSGHDLDCILTSGKAVLPDTHPSSVVLLAPETTGGWSGLRADGRLQAELRGQDNSHGAEMIPAYPVVDQVIAIRSDAVATRLQRKALVARLLPMRSEGLARLHSVSGFVDHVQAEDPVLGHFQSTRKRIFTDPARHLKVSGGERGLLLEDARLAWRFIERFTDASSGLCAGTVYDGNVQRINRDVTMWDIASQLQGIMAARDLKLIDLAEAQSRADRLLDNLPVIDIDGLRLPPAFHALTSGPGRAPEFDVCDTGRFLVALSAARSAKLITSARAQEAFSRWDIADVVRDGRPFSFREGDWQDGQLSHCTPYTSRGMAAFGLRVAPPYSLATDVSRTEAQMRLLYQVAFIGHYGSEPVLLEAVELGHTATSSYLADVLFNAQLSYFERTGRLKCASETPLSFSPWFTYQGLRIDRPQDEAWVILANGPPETLDTEAFRAKAELVSSKSAFLWAAAYPHPYSTRLLEFVRENARLEDFGFSVGIVTETSKPVENYSDINTNGIILTAIAKMLSSSAG